jgi:hypothetical protein
VDRFLRAVSVSQTVEGLSLENFYVPFEHLSQVLRETTTLAAFGFVNIRLSSVGTDVARELAAAIGRNRTI